MILPLMSSLIAIICASITGEYDYIKGVDSKSVKVGVYMPLGKSYEGNFALQVKLVNCTFYEVL